MTNSLKFLHPRSLKFLSDELATLIAKHLWAKILIAMGLGIGVGVIIGPDVGQAHEWLSTDDAQTIGNWLALPGYLFLAIVQMVVVPLVISSVLRGISASEDVESLKRIGVRLVPFFLLTTMLAIGIGIGITTLLQPGVGLDIPGAGSAETQRATMAAQRAQETPQPLPQRLIGILPTNPIEAAVHTDMLKIVLAAILFGLALVNMVPSKAKAVLDLMGAVQEMCMIIVRWAMALAPWAVFGLLAQVVARTGLDVLASMAAYVGTVVLGLVTMGAVYVALVGILARHSPWRFLANIREVALLAFSTSSSAAVMPLSIKTAEEKLAVRPSIAQFVIPLGATVNMAGTALYQGAATIFLAQVFNVDLTAGQLLMVVITATGAAVGAPATPGVGIVILAMLLTSVGIPAEGIALILGVDRILDMARTTINVVGDLTACVLMDRWVGGPKTAEQQLATEAALEITRTQTGADTLTVDVERGELITETRVENGEIVPVTTEPLPEVLATSDAP